MRTILTIAISMFLFSCSGNINYNEVGTYVVGGTQDTTNTYSNVVAIVGSNGTSCSGVLIGDTHVLTAAACINSSENYQVFFGPEVSTSTEVRNVLSFSIHPLFNIGSPENDIAVAHLDSSAPAAIPFASLNSNPLNGAFGSNVTYAGYGINHLTTGVFGTRRYGVMSIDDVQGSTVIFYYDGNLPCLGDYGAPVFMTISGQSRVIALVSSMDSQCNLSATAVRIDTQNSFINSAIIVENCSDNTDNNGNGLVDCTDPECFSDVACEEICDNNIDDDGDNLVDCEDPDCAEDPDCEEEVEICDNNVDDDGDNLTDCEDPDCAGDPACEEEVEICDNNIDDDGDNLTDCEDPDCDSDPACGEEVEVCDNGTDDDGDNLVDCEDPDCDSDPACGEEVEVCDNNIDDDGDNLIDCEDPDCAEDPACGEEVEVCDNGTDDDGDNLIDCEDPDCAENPICAENKDDSSGCSCSSTTSSKPGSGVFLMLLAAIMILRKRRKQWT